MPAEDTPELLDGRRRRWQEHNQVRRQAIIDAAIAVLERQAPGDEMQVQAVADEATMSRTVIYRHFEDRADLDRAVQWQICADVGEALLPALAHDGTPEAIVRRLIASFVNWATAHPSLFWFAERDFAGWGASPVAEALELVADQIEDIIETVVTYEGVELSEHDRAALDPWVFGMISAVMASVRRWLARDVREPDADVFIELLGENMWLQLNGMAASRGLDLPELPISELLKALGQGEG